MFNIEKRHIRVLWKRFAQIYGHRWVSISDSDVDGVWLEGLKDLTPELLGIGIQKCVLQKNEWPPSLPQFRGMCLNVPNETDMINDAIYLTSKNIHPVARSIRTLIGSWDLSHLSLSQLERKAKHFYSQACDTHEVQTIKLSRNAVAIEREMKKQISNHG